MSRSVITGGLPVLRLAGTVGTGTGRSLAYAVLARVAEAAQPPGTVILELTGPAAALPAPAGTGARRPGGTIPARQGPGGTVAGPPAVGTEETCAPQTGVPQTGVPGTGGAGTGGQDAWEELCMLAGTLHRCAIALRLVIAPVREHDLLLATAPGPPGPPVHPTLRAAVLATYAALPGPGLVTSGVRADLAMPAEPLSIGAAGAADTASRTGPVFTPGGWGAAREAVGGLGSA